MARFLFTARLVIGVMAGMVSALAPIRGEPVVTADRTGLERETFRLINQYRQAHDLPPLRWDAAIAKVARVHSRDMALGEVDFGHAGFGDRVGQLKIILVGLKGAGENVLETDDPDEVAARAVALWLKSPPHLHNIRGDFNCSGLGIWVNKEGVVYFTQIFIKLEPKTGEAQTQSTPPVVSPFGLLASPRTRTGP